MLSKSWSVVNPHERAKVLYSIARLLQKNSRLFSVLETIDNGKPIRESRDIDIPLAQRHLLSRRTCTNIYEQNPKYGANRSMWPDNTLELPIADVGLENCTCFSGR